MSEAVHGTRTAYVRGCRCRPCKDAHAKATRERIAARGGQYDSHKVATRARSRARERLMKAFPDEYAKLYTEERAIAMREFGLVPQDRTS